MITSRDLKVSWWVILVRVRSSPCVSSGFFLAVVGCRLVRLALDDAKPIPMRAPRATFMSSECWTAQERPSWLGRLSM